MIPGPRHEFHRKQPCGKHAVKTATYFSERKKCKTALEMSRTPVTTYILELV